MANLLKIFLISSFMFILSASGTESIQKTFGDPRFAEAYPALRELVVSHLLNNTKEEHILFLGRSLLIPELIVQNIDSGLSTRIPGSEINSGKYPKSLDEPSGFNGLTYREYLKGVLPSAEELRKIGKKYIKICDFGATGESLEIMSNLIIEYYKDEKDISIIKKIFRSDFYGRDSKRIHFDKTEDANIFYKILWLFRDEKFKHYSSANEFVWGQKPENLFPSENRSRFEEARIFFYENYMKKDHSLSSYFKKNQDCYMLFNKKSSSSIPYF